MQIPRLRLARSAPLGMTSVKVRGAVRKLSSRNKNPRQVRLGFFI
jgi:hypothetical protein